jgi:hypothetical protein
MLGEYQRYTAAQGGKCSGNGACVHVRVDHIKMLPAQQSPEIPREGQADTPLDHSIHERVIRHARPTKSGGKRSSNRAGNGYLMSATVKGKREVDRMPLAAPSIK